MESLQEANQLERERNKILRMHNIAAKVAALAAIIAAIAAILSAWTTLSNKTKVELLIKNTQIINNVNR